MQLIKAGNKYFPNCYPSEIKNGVLEYFQKGWKKTKAFTVVEGVELPDRWSDISWLEIAKLCDQYGMEVADAFASRKTAGIVSRRTTAGYTVTYRLIKDWIPENFDARFFECLANDSRMGSLGVYLFDIVETDARLARLDPDYTSVPCTHKGQKTSMKDYVKLVYGEDYVKIIERLIKSGIEQTEIEPIKL